MQKNCRVVEKILMYTHCKAEAQPSRKLRTYSLEQGLKNSLVCSSVTSENFKLKNRKFNRAVSVQSVQSNFSHFSFLQLISN
jgi:hypothetical protein